eukprot:gb/GFBE01026043.1/.p1 GENE.gb/GFBE01026043.1/~~gb/GFBE01026043.1/.p1  ORF type:complete len:633 (+),score=89.83 gb/GFBE01026043.1/:1-1899(+)
MGSRYAPVSAGSSYAGGGGGGPYTGQGTLDDALAWARGWLDPAAAEAANAPKGMIALSQAPQLALASQGQGQAVGVYEHYGNVQRNNEWTLLENGLIVQTASPHFALAVEGGIVQKGARVVLREHSGKAEYFNRWKVQANGMIVLWDTPSFDLNVENDNLRNGANVIIWESRKPSRNNTWKSPHSIGGYVDPVAGSNEAFVLQVVGTRGNPNTIWSAITGSMEIRTGFLTAAKGLNPRDGRDQNSTYLFVHDDLSHEYAAVMVKEPAQGGFLLKVLSSRADRVQSQVGYVACHQYHNFDRRDNESTYSFVHSNRDSAAIFMEERTSGGFLLRIVGCQAGPQHHQLRYGYLTAVQVNEGDDRDSSSTYVYAHEDSKQKYAAVFQYEGVSARGLSSWTRYASYVRQQRVLLGACACCLLIGAIIGIAFLIVSTSSSSTAQREAIYYETTVAPLPEPLVTAEPMQIIVPYNCDHNPFELWSDTKKSWCCEHYGLHCSTTLAPPVTYPTTTGPRFMWVPIPVTPSPEPVSEEEAEEEAHDCYVDVLKWHDWALSRQRWCCNHHGIACAPEHRSGTGPYDCADQYPNQWPSEQVDYCCMNYGRGCPDDMMAQAIPAVPSQTGSYTFEDAVAASQVDA